jgi:dinuclear metal center YbgI/SA1388 family protein
MQRSDLVAYLDEYLRVPEVEDVSNNGLQVEGAGEVLRVALAVDASLAAFEATRDADAQMLIVHHGLFWGEPVLLTGFHRERIHTLLQADLSLYAVHLPLDMHPEVGNNATLARWLGLAELVPFGEYKGLKIGVSGSLPVPLALSDLLAQVEAHLGEPVLAHWSFGSSQAVRLGIVSGGGAFVVGEAADAGLDTILTGELSHTVYHEARERGINVIFAGHYASETVGLRALADHLAARFALDTLFLDLPTGA